MSVTVTYVERETAGEWWEIHTKDGQEVARFARSDWTIIERDDKYYLIDHLKQLRTDFAGTFKTILFVEGVGNRLALRAEIESGMMMTLIDRLKIWRTIQTEATTAGDTAVANGAKAKADAIYLEIKQVVIAYNNAG